MSVYQFKPERVMQALKQKIAVTVIAALAMGISCNIMAAATMMIDPGTTVAHMPVIDNGPITQTTSRPIYNWASPDASAPVQALPQVVFHPVNTDHGNAESVASLSPAAGDNANLSPIDSAN